VVRSLSFPLLVFVLALATYANTLDAPLMWDDRALLSAEVQMLQPLASYFQKPFWMPGAAGELSAYFRPLTTLSLSLDFWLHAGNVAGLHLTNVLFHALNAVLLYCLLRRYRAGELAALALSVLWALAPRSTEAVAWISGRTDVLATAFVLMALLVHRPGELRRGSASALLVLFGLFCKEVAMAGAAALVAAELAHHCRRLRTLRASYWRGVLASIAPLGIALGVYFALRSNALAGSAAGAPALGAFGRGALVLESIGRYAGMLLWPWQPALQQGRLDEREGGFMALGGLVLLAALVFAARWQRASFLLGAGDARAMAPARERGQSVLLGERGLRAPVCDPQRAAAGALFGASLSLVLHVVPLPIGTVSADRFLYVPLAGLSLLAAPRARAWLRDRRVRAAVGLLVVSFGVATYRRAKLWGDELALWTTTYRETPVSVGLPGNELGNVYYRAGLYAAAAHIYRHTAEHSPARRSQALANWASAMLQIGRYPASDTTLAELCLGEQRSKFCVDAALAELTRLDLQSAARFGRRARELSLDRATADEILAALPRLEQALRDLRREPEGLAARFRVFVLSGQRPPALTAALELLRRGGSDPARALLARGEADAALARKAAEYWARFGPPFELERVLDDAASARHFDEQLRAIMALRASEARHVAHGWHALGFATAMPLDPPLAAPEG
jgi:hypothetical protein